MMREMVKNGGEVGVTMTWKLCMAALRRGGVPVGWRKAGTVPLDHHQGSQTS